MMKDDDFKLLRGFDNRRTNGRTDIYEYRVTFVAEKQLILLFTFSFSSPSTKAGARVQENIDY